MSGLKYENISGQEVCDILKELIISEIKKSKFVMTKKDIGNDMWDLIIEESADFSPERLKEIYDKANIKILS